jgi:hypothetical protein
VTYKAKPIAGAHVSFSPVEGSGRAATGITDSDGQFTLGTFAATDGAIPGPYRVSVIARGPDRPPRPGEVDTGMPGETMPGEALIPAKYFAPDTSGLTHEVKPGRNYAEIGIPD